MAAKKIKLLPCPFCGSPAFVYGSDDVHFYAACSSKVCFCSLGERYDVDGMSDHIFGDQESAAYNWNKRPKSAVENLQQTTNKRSTQRAKPRSARA